MLCSPRKSSAYPAAATSLNRVMPQHATSTSAWFTWIPLQSRCQVRPAFRRNLASSHFSSPRAAFGPMFKERSYLGNCNEVYKRMGLCGRNILQCLGVHAMPQLTLLSWQSGEPVCWSSWQFFAPEKLTVFSFGRLSEALAPGIRSRFETNAGSEWRGVEPVCRAQCGRFSRSSRLCCPIARTQRASSLSKLSAQRGSATGPCTTTRQAQVHRRPELRGGGCRRSVRISGRVGAASIRMCAERRTSPGGAVRYFGGCLGVSIAKVVASHTPPISQYTQVPQRWISRRVERK